MADFEDITGWREELAKFRRTDEGRAFFNKYSSWDRTKGRAPKLPYETVIHLAELYFKHREIHEALKKSAAWGAYLDVHPDFGQDDEGYDELCPWEDNRTIHDFARWYAMKVQLPYDRNNYGAGTALAEAVVNGTLPSLSAPETRDYAERKYSDDISFSGEGRL